MKKLISLILAALMLCACAAMAETKTIAPETVTFDPNAIADGIYNVAFDPANVAMNEDGTAVIQGVTLYSTDTYDIVDVAQLQPGDAITFGGEDITVETIERNGDYIEINGGTMDGGATLATYEDTNGWVAVEYDDLCLYTEQCTLDFPVSATVAYHDESDLEKDPVDANTADEVIKLMQVGADEYLWFGPSATEITIENGMIVAINHTYAP